MNKSKFQNLCDRVLIPKIDKAMRNRLRKSERQLESITEVIDMIAAALARLEGEIDRVSKAHSTDESERTIR